MILHDPSIYTCCFQDVSGNKATYSKQLAQAAASPRTITDFLHERATTVLLSADRKASVDHLLNGKHHDLQPLT